MGNCGLKRERGGILKYWRKRFRRESHNIVWYLPSTGQRRRPTDGFVLGLRDERSRAVWFGGSFSFFVHQFPIISFHRLRSCSSFCIPDWSEWLHSCFHFCPYFSSPIFSTLPTASQNCLSKQNLKNGERSNWIRGRDGWSLIVSSDAGDVGGTSTGGRESGMVEGWSESGSSIART